jgi:hypothetical protein
MERMVRTHRVENRLAKAVSAPGGMTVAEALSRAAAGVERVREECMAALDAKIAEIDAATTREAFSSTAADVARVYALANEVLNEAGVFGLSELSEAGSSLCELTSNWRDGGIDLEPVRVHVSAMKSLRRPEVAGDAALRAAVLAGLRAVAAKLSRVRAEPAR